MFSSIALFRPATLLYSRLLHELIEVGLAAHVQKSYIIGKPSLTWDDLKDLAPEELEIPDVKKVVLVEEENI